MNWNKEIIQKVWENGRAVPGADPRVWRKDSCGAWIKRSEYGKSSSLSSYAWEIDHILPNGQEEIYNLQPLQWENKRYKKTHYPHQVCKITGVLGRNI